jgi:hypothetical protein
MRSKMTEANLQNSEFRGSNVQTRAYPRGAEGRKSEKEPTGRNKGHGIDLGEEKADQSRGSMSLDSRMHVGKGSAEDTSKNQSI